MISINKIFKRKPKTLEYAGKCPVIYTNGRLRATASKIVFLKDGMEIIFIVEIPRMIGIYKATIKCCNIKHYETFTTIYCVAGNTIEFTYGLAFDGYTQIKEVK